MRDHHSTIDQGYRIINVIESALEKRQVCSAVFLYISQAFDKVWHLGLLYKLRWFFRVKQDYVYSNLQIIQSCVPQGSILGPILYLLYTYDLPTDGNYFTATFADDTALLALEDTVKNQP